MVVTSAIVREGDADGEGRVNEEEKRWNRLSTQLNGCESSRTDEK